LDLIGRFEDIWSLIMMIMDIIPATSCNYFSKTQLLVELHPELFSPVVGPVEEDWLPAWPLVFIGRNM
jgi:hypothetical protein